MKRCYPRQNRVDAATGDRDGSRIDSKKYTRTVRTLLVYRFNWGGPVVAKY
jgi:outer membrane immunogenic protein